jgi:hypothetical protein
MRNVFKVHASGAYPRVKHHKMIVRSYKNTHLGCLFLKVFSDIINSDKQKFSTILAFEKNLSF